MKAKELRSSFSPGDFYDTVLLMLDGTGNFMKAVQISNNNAQINMYSASNGIFALNGVYFFAGWSAGFNTMLQKKTYIKSLVN